MSGMTAWHCCRLLPALFAAFGPSFGTAQDWECTHCDIGEAFSEFLKPDAVGDSGVPAGPASDVHVMWQTHVEVVPITTDIGGWEDPSFHERLTQEAVRGWKDFRHNIAPGLPKGHSLKQFLTQSHAGALNDGFFHYQKRLFEASGVLEKALDDDNDGPVETPHPDANS